MTEATENVFKQASPLDDIGDIGEAHPIGQDARETFGAASGPTALNTVVDAIQPEGQGTGPTMLGTALQETGPARFATPLDNIGEVAPSDVSVTGAVARGAARGALPAAGTLAAAGAGAELGGAAGSFAGPWGTLAGGVIGGLGGAIAGGAAVDHAQSWLLSKLPDSFVDAFGQDERSQRLDQQQHPVASFVGGMIPFAVTMQPTKLVTAAALPEGATALQRLMANPVTARLFGGGVQGGMELGMEAAHGEVDWRKVAIATGFGIVWNKPNAIGERLTELGAAPARGVLGRPSPTIAQASDAKVIGPGVTEAVFSGTHQQAPEAAMTAQEAARNEATAMGEPPEANVVDIARQMEPELFARYDELQNRQRVFGAQTGPGGEVIPALDTHLAATNAEIEKLGPEIAAAYRRAADTVGVETVQPEPFKSFAEMLAAHEHGAPRGPNEAVPPSEPAVPGAPPKGGANYTKDDNGTITFREPGNSEDSKLIIREVPKSVAGSHGAFSAVYPEEAAGKFVAIRVDDGLQRTMHRGGGFVSNPEKPMYFDSAAEAEAAAKARLNLKDASPAVLQRTVGEQRAFIADDVTQRLIAAGRPEEEAKAAGQLIAARYITRAGRFEGKLGTPEELYARESAAIAGPEGKGTPPAAAPRDAYEAAGATQREAHAAAETKVRELAAKPASEPGVIARDFDTADRIKAEWRKATPFKEAEPFIKASWHNQRALAETAEQIGADLGLTFKNPGIKARSAEDVPSIVKDLEGHKKARKARERLFEKAKKHGIGGVTDQVRGGFEVKTPEQADQAIAKLGEKFQVIDEGWFQTEAGYFDRKAYIRFPDGMIGEVQFWPPGMLEAKSKRGGHDLYAQVRELPPNHPDISGHLQKMRDLYAEVVAALPAEWKAVLGSGGNAPNLLPNASGESTRPSMATSAALAGDHLPPENTQASPELMKNGSPSNEPALMADMIGPPGENVRTDADIVNAQNYKEETSAEPPVSGKAMVFRIGGAAGGLENRNAGNLRSVASHVLRMFDEEMPQSAAGSGEVISGYHVDLPQQMGPYQAINAKRGVGEVSQVGREAKLHGDNVYSISYSFPGGFEGRRVESISLADVAAILKDMGYAHPGQAGTVEVEQAIRTALDRARGTHVEPVRASIEAAEKVNSLIPAEQKRELPVYAPDQEVKAPGEDKPAGVFMFKPTALEVDAKRFQFKSGGDEYGVTGALRNVTKWDPAKAQAIIVWEQKDGKLFVADGHQRAGLARRLTEQGSAKDIQLPGILYREKDGIGADDIRAIAAVTNIANGSGSALDGAKVLRARPDLMDGSLPLSVGKGKQAAALARLGDEPFRMVVNDVVPEHYGAVVGELIPNDPARQTAAMKAIARFEPKNADEAAVLTQRVAQAELAKAEAGAQGSMFGDLDAAESTAGEEMKIVGRAIADLKKDKALFARVLKNAERIEETGSQIERGAAQSIATDAEIFAKTLTSEAYTAGPIRQELIAAARELKNGKASIGDAATRIVAALRAQAEAHGLNRAGAGGHAEREFAQKDLLDYEAGAEGKPQSLLPGVKPVTQRDLIQAAANKPLAPKKAQKAADEGLFGSAKDQKELFQREKVGNSQVDFPDKDHVALFEVGRRLSEGETVPSGELKAIFDRFHGFMSTDPLLEQHFRNPGDVRDAARDYYDGIVEELAKGREAVRAPDMIEPDMREDWYRRALDEAAASGKKPKALKPIPHQFEMFQNEKPVRLESEGDIAKVRTGQPVTFRYQHNTASATKIHGVPNKESPFGRGFEPSGKYMTVASEGRAIPEHLESGEVTFRNPLVVPNDNLKWKERLSEQYGGKTGKELSKAIIADGHDGVITTEPTHISEVLDLTSFDEAKALYQIARGKIRIGANRRPLITLLKDANPSTFIHETGHEFLEQMVKDAGRDDAPQVIREDMKIINDWLGIKPEKAPPPKEGMIRFYHGTAYKDASGFEGKTFVSPYEQYARDYHGGSNNVLYTDLTREQAIAAGLFDEINNRPRNGSIEGGATKLRPLDLPGEIQTRHHEKFARGFEQYLREGVAPSQGLAKVFAQFRNWLLSIYQSLKGLGPEISPEIRGVFDRMLELEPQRTVIAPERLQPDLLHDIHETEAAHTPPHEAEPAADRIIAETARYIADQPPEIQGEIQAAIVRDAEAQAAASGGEAGTGAGRGGEVGPGGAGSVPEPGGGAGGTEHGEVKPGGGAAAAEGASGARPDTRSELGKDPGTALAPGPVDLFGSRESPFTDKAGNIRLDTLNTSEDVKQAIRDSAAENNDFIGDRRGVVTDGQVLELAHDIGMDGAERLVQSHVTGQAFNAEQVVALRKLLRESATNVSTAAKAAAESGSEAAIMAYVQARDRLRMVQKTVAGVTAEAGRALRAFRTLPGEADTAAIEQMVREATGKTLFQLQTEAKLMAQMDTPAKVNKLMQEVENRSLGGMLLEIWINGLLSGASTHATNMISNTTFMIQHFGPERLVAGMIGGAARAAGREGPHVSVGELGAIARGAKEGFAPALQAAGTAYRKGASTLLPGEEGTHGGLLEGVVHDDLVPRGTLNESVTMREVASGAFGAIRGVLDSIVSGGALVTAGGVKGAPLWELKYAPSGQVPDIGIKGMTIPVGSLVRAPGRFLATMDTFYRSLNYSMAKNAIAYRTALDEGLTGRAFDARVADIRNNPTAEVMEQARTEASSTTFMDRGGDLVRRINSLVNYETAGGVKPFKFVMPFTNVISRILDQTFVKRTPLGVFSPELRADLMGKNGNIAQETAAARMLVGTTMMLGFGSLAAQGLVTGSGPKDPSEAAVWRLTHQPHSVKIGNVYYDIGKLGPLGMLASIAADLHEIQHIASEDDLAKAGSYLMHAFVQNVLDQSVLQGPAELIKAIETPEQYGPQYIKSFLSSFVPNMVGNIAKARDPYVRQTWTVLDAIKAKLPGYSTELHPKIDLWGQPVPTREALIGTGLTSVYMQKVNADPVNVAMGQLGMKMAPVEKKIRGVDLTPAEYEDYARTAGVLTKQDLDRVVMSPAWETWSPGAKMAAIEHVIKMNRETATGIMLGRYRHIAVEAYHNKVEKLTTGKKK